MLATPRAIVAEQAPRDFGQKIGADYWRQTPHVFSRQGGENERCGLCLLPDSGQHREREAYGPQPTIVSVNNDAQPPYYHFSASLSCGHGPVGFSTTPAHAPQVGATYDCWDCRRLVDDRNRPGLSESIREQIEAQLPKCPECGGAVAKIPFVKHTVHAYEADVDAQSGEILAGSEHHDALDERPDWTRQTAWGTYDLGEIRVECANNHDWLETRLAYRHNYGAATEHQWLVLDPKETQS